MRCRATAYLRRTHAIARYVHTTDSLLTVSAAVRIMLMLDAVLLSPLL